MNTKSNVCVVFCRLVDISEMDDPELVEAFKVLDATIQELGEYGHYGSMVGAFVVLPQSLRLSVEVARDIRRRCAEQGVKLSLGVSDGRLERVLDLTHINLVGTPINYAARLASLEAGRIAISDSIVKRVVKADRTTEEWFSKQKETSKVKETDVAFRWYQDPEELQPCVDRPRADVNDNKQQVDVAVYDLEGYSELRDNEQQSLFEQLHTQVRNALRAVGADLDATAATEWYSPAGDGGGVVFQGKPEALWTFAGTLAASANHDGLKLRIGIDRGEAYVIEKPIRRPVGTPLIHADKLSAISSVGGMCVSSGFHSQLKNYYMHNWVVQPARDEDEPDVFDVVDGGQTDVVAPRQPDLMDAPVVTFFGEPGPWDQSLLVQSFDLFEGLFEEDLLMDRDVIEDELDESSSTGESPLRWRNLWAVLHIADQVLGIAYVAGLVGREYCFGLYLGTNEELPSPKRLEHWDRKLIQKVSAKLRQLFPDLKTLVIEVDFVDRELLTQAVARGRIRGEADETEVLEHCWRLQRIRYYQKMGGAVVMESDGRPFPYLMPALRPPYTVDRSVPMTLMLLPMGTTNRQRQNARRFVEGQQHVVDDVLKFIYYEYHSEFRPPEEDYEEYIRKIKRLVTAKVGKSCGLGVLQEIPGLMPLVRSEGLRERLKAQRRPGCKKD
ncbi:MAG: hypothetical protein HOL01_25925 [Planctomycetaceae bacterium]|jgi:class 3 adenylate cyclase|nr:hypothetical protein [Planctomycetaceae bacterium]MBT6484796.1 hypothetical protein [Planctomycetaceae bacterium]MBT6497967.1 hypothetical protein [Planctomycetaceae bacterium]